jgi:hypothetical protein
MDATRVVFLDRIECITGHQNIMARRMADGMTQVCPEEIYRYTDGRRILCGRQLAFVKVEMGIDTDQQVPPFVPSPDFDPPSDFDFDSDSQCRD